MNMNLNVYDNTIPHQVRYEIWNYCTKSTYRLGWQDSQETNKNDLNTYSTWTEEELKESGLYPYILGTVKDTDWFTNKNIKKIIVNLVRSNDIHYIHGHSKSQVALYYVNLDWQDGWYGETLFYEPENLDTIAYASQYIPGRIILFDGNIPHSIRPQSVKAPKYRFTISVFFM